MKIDLKKVATFLWKKKETVYRMGRVAVKFVKDKFKKEKSDGLRKSN